MPNIKQIRIKGADYDIYDELAHTRIDNIQLQKGEKGDKGDKGEKGDTGASGITVPASGMFTLSGDTEGNLWAYYNDSDTAPTFETDTDGNIYYITPDA